MKKVVCVAGCLITVIILLEFTQRLFINEKVYTKSYEFYSNTNRDEYDVLFLGSSHISRSVIPMELWKDYGITSYNLGNVGQLKGVDYWVLKDALTRVTPKLVVVDIYPMDNNNRVNDQFFGILHETFDLMPMSVNKFCALNELFDWELRKQYLFPMVYNHSNWDSFYDYFVGGNRHQSVQKGSWIDMFDDDNNASVSLCEAEPLPMINEVHYEDTLSIEYLRKIIELCQGNGIDVLLMNSPYLESQEDMKWNNRAQIIADEYGIKLLDFNCLENLISYSTDSYDGVHTNSLGARKVTKYLGNYLQNKCMITARSEVDVIKRWDDYYEEYLEYKVDRLKQQSKMESYMMLLCDSDYDTLVEVNNLECFDNKLISKLFCCLGISEEDIPPNAKYVCIKAGGREISYVSEESAEQGTETVIGFLQISNMEDGGYSVMVDGNEAIIVDSVKKNNTKVNRFSVFRSSEKHNMLDKASVFYTYDVENSIIH